MVKKMNPVTRAVYSGFNKYSPQLKRSDNGDIDPNTLIQLKAKARLSATAKTHPLIVDYMLYMATHGSTIREISKECEVGLGTVRKYIINASIDGYQKKIVDQEAVDYLLKHTRMLFNCIALECQCSESYVSHRARDVGVVKRSESR